MNYSIECGTFPVVIVNLEEGESIHTDGGAMAWMSPNMEMETEGGGSFGKALGRLFSGENDHHKIEAMFKAFAKAMDQATMFDERITDVLSTKGTL